MTMMDKYPFIVETEAARKNWQAFDFKSLYPPIVAMDQVVLDAMDRDIEVQPYYISQGVYDDWILMMRAMEDEEDFQMARYFRLHDLRQGVIQTSVGEFDPPIWLAVILLSVAGNLLHYFLH